MNHVGLHTIKIGDLGKIVTGKTPSTKQADFWDGDIPFVTPVDLQKGKRILGTERTVTENGANAVRGALLPPKSICVSCIGNLGYTALTTCESVSNQQINSIVPSKDYDADFVYYLMKSLWSVFKSLEGQSTTLSILNKTLFSKIEITVPDLETQKRIARILSSLDDKIEVNNRINRNLEEQAKAIFKSWFVDFEPFQDGEFVDTELGRIPQGWKISSLSNIASFLNGLAMQKYRPEEDDPGLPVLKIKELHQGYCDTNSDRCSSEIPEQYIIRDGDVVFSWSGTLLVDFWCGGECGLNQHLFKVTSEKFNKWFYFLWISHHLAEFSAIAEGKATTMGHIKREHLDQAKVLLPSASDYNTISSILKPLCDQIVLNRIVSKQIAILRDNLLPKLMSGEITIS